MNPHPQNGNGYPAPETQKREILRPSSMPYNVWLTCTLDSAAVEETGQYGPQWRYFLKHAGEPGRDAILYANKKLQAAIDHSGARQSNDIGIRKVRRGRADEWDVQVVTLDPDPPQREPRPGTAATHPAPITHPPTAEQALGIRPPQPAAELGHYPDPVDEHITEQTKASQRTVHETALLHCYLSAIALADHAVHVAADKHKMLLTPEFGDIRAIAATLYIQQCGGGR